MSRFSVTRVVRVEARSAIVICAKWHSYALLLESAMHLSCQARTWPSHTQETSHLNHALQKVQGEAKDARLRLERVLAFQDKILVYREDEKEHVSSLNAVLRALKEKALTLSKDKCKFAVSIVGYLGHDVSDDSISPCPELHKAIDEVAVRADREQL
ncbi:hypothetical protein NDU88_012618 [Pleurodeles waltl]|uniref:ribonuclease H n=1 Tax=Pleurodeles waltl TaxID=8319 RepID=A0AAV7R186_PLEWA|nr:hypothetical protein NDU88_012618 [Pleurodeles waltl]